MIKKLNLLPIVSIILIGCIGITCSLYAASGNARVFYTSTQGPDTSNTVSGYLNDMGYSSSRTSGASASTIRDALGTNRVVVVFAHGSPGSSAGVTANSIANQYSSLSNLNLVYLQCCNSGTSSPTNGSLPSTFYSLGVKSHITFQGYFTGGTDTGIFYFTKRAFYYMKRQTVVRSITNAQSDLYNGTGEYSGSDNVVIYGGSKTIY